MTATATARATADRRIVSLVLRHLSDMKYKDRRQRGSDQPVEFLEFRPTLVPSILVSKLWAEEGTSILWRRYPHLPALQHMSPDRQQWYTNKIERLFVLGPIDDDTDLAYLEGLEWPNLKTLELEVDWKKCEKAISPMLHVGLQHLDFLGPQSSESTHVAGTVLPIFFKSCPHLRSIRIGPDVIDPKDPVPNQELLDLLDSAQSIIDVCIRNTSIFGKDQLFVRLSQRPGLEALEIDLDPGLQLLPYFSDPNVLPVSFRSLKRLHIMCYPEIAVALPSHLQLIEELHVDIARIPNQAQEDGDLNILDDVVGGLLQCGKLQSLRVNIGQVAIDFPSPLSYPRLSGTSMMKLVAGCPNLQEISFLASEPAAIDGSMISSLQFEAFCKGLPQLISLSLKLHPQTAIELESTALESLARNCPLLETLRLKISLHLPDSQIPKRPASSQPTETSFQDQISTEEFPVAPSITVPSNEGNTSVHIGDFSESNPSVAFAFKNLRHLAFARPQSILSITSDSYTVSSNSQASSVVDPLVEQSLVQSWAQPLAAQFPHLEVLEAWGDWTGQDNEVLNYFLPREELLATTWEFLSGVEQDLWEEEGDVDEILSDSDWKENRTDRYSFNSCTSADWDLASLVNEFSVEEHFEDSPRSDAYEEEPEDMLTPGRVLDREEAYFGHTDVKYTPPSGPALVALAADAAAC
ncbi:abc transporter protein [Stemphylium lycopersici]|nr:abc transporter protein [Stemphylium lycopersici]